MKSIFFFIGDLIMISTLVKFIAFSMIICNFCIMYRIYNNEVFDDLVGLAFMLTMMMVLIGIADFVLHYKDDFCEYLRDKYKK